MTPRTLRLSCGAAALAALAAGIAISGPAGGLLAFAALGLGALFFYMDRQTVMLRTRRNAEDRAGNWSILALGAVLAVLALAAAARIAL